MGRSTAVMRAALTSIAHVFLVIVALAAPARADDYADAEAADRALDFARALALYDAARAKDPSSPFAAHAEARANELRRHREGDFVPYAMLERVRRDDRATPAAIDALVASADEFPPGAVRVETWALAAAAYGERFDRPTDAERLYRRILGAPEADDLALRNAARDLVELRLARSDVRGAADAARLAGDHLDPRLAKKVRRLARRRWVHLASIGVLGLGLVLAAVAVVRARAEKSRVRSALRGIVPAAMAFGAFVAVGGALLATSFRSGTWRPFAALGLVAVPLVALARAWAAAGSARPTARMGRAATCAGGVIAASFLVLERIDASYLDGLGL